MLLLMPDAMFEDDAEIERGVLGSDVEIALHHELVADRIPDERWRAADALIVYLGVIGLLLFALVAWTERKLLFWHKSEIFEIQGTG